MQTCDALLPCELALCPPDPPRVGGIEPLVEFVSDSDNDFDGGEAAIRRDKRTFEGCHCEWKSEMG